MQAIYDLVGDKIRDMFHSQAVTLPIPIAGAIAFTSLIICIAANG